MYSSALRIPMPDHPSDASENLLKPSPFVMECIGQSPRRLTQIAPRGEVEDEREARRPQRVQTAGEHERTGEEKEQRAQVTQPRGYPPRAVRKLLWVVHSSASLDNVAEGARGDSEEGERCRAEDEPLNPQDKGPRLFRATEGIVKPQIDGGSPPHTLQPG